MNKIHLLTVSKNQNTNIIYLLTHLMSKSNLKYINSILKYVDMTKVPNTVMA